MLAPIKVKICDRNKDMLTAYGDKKAQVETQSGKIVIKKKKDILPTDRVITYLSNDYIAPIKIKIIDLDIVFAFLSGELARLAFSSWVSKKSLVVVGYGKPRHKIKFLHLLDKSFPKLFGKSHEKNTIKGIIEKGTSIFKITTKSCSILTKNAVKAIFAINEKQLAPQSMAFKIPLVRAFIFTLYHKTIGDITEGTLESLFSTEATISDISPEKIGNISQSTIANQLVRKMVVDDIFYMKKEI